MKFIIFTVAVSMLTIGCSHAGTREEQKIISTLPKLEVYGSRAANGKSPSLKPPKIKIRHVDDQIKDGVFIPAHLEYHIQEQVRWEE